MSCHSPLTADHRIAEANGVIFQTCEKSAITKTTISTTVEAPAANALTALEPHVAVVADPIRKFGLTRNFGDSNPIITSALNVRLPTLTDSERVASAADGRTGKGNPWKMN